MRTPEGQLHEAQVLVDLEVVVGVETDLLDVKGFRAVDVGHRDGYEFQFPVHSSNLGAGCDIDEVTTTPVPFEQADRALRDLEAGDVRGAAVLTVAG